MGKDVVLTEKNSFFVSLDRIEEGLAVLLTDNGFRWLINADELPENCLEGSVLKVSITVDTEETTKRIKRIRELQQQLLDRSNEENC